MEAFALVSLLGAGLAVRRAKRSRGALVARFLTVLAALQIAISMGVYVALDTAGLERLRPAFWGLQALTLLYLSSAVLPGMRKTWQWMLLAWPAHWFVAGTFLALPWALSALTPWTLPAVWLPYALAGAGLLRSVVTLRETVDLDLRGGAPVLARRPQRALSLVQRRFGFRPRAAPSRLRVVQITDPHIGPFQSVERLRRTCERAVAAGPDLIVLTGDYLTVPSQDSADHLALALAPLQGHPHVYACMGNHDLETPELVREALHRAGVRLLEDEAVTVQTPAGLVQVLGLAWRWRNRETAMTRALKGTPRPTDAAGRPAFRLVLLHDPSAFQLCPDGSADLVLSGHTHGGQVGFLSLGVHWTALSLAGMPDEGPWALGRNRLYVHRGNGFYGFPLRVGVPGEESVLDLELPGSIEPADA